MFYVSLLLKVHETIKYGKGEGLSVPRIWQYHIWCYHKIFSKDN